MHTKTLIIIYNYDHLMYILLYIIIYTSNDHNGEQLTSHIFKSPGSGTFSTHGPVM